MRSVYLVTLWGINWGIYSSLAKAKRARLKIAREEHSDPDDCSSIYKWTLDKARSDECVD
jgi:hypothetical protein